MQNKQVFLVKNVADYDGKKQVLNRFYVSNPEKANLYLMLQSKIGNYEVTEVKA